MCFSAEASFIASGALIIIGTVAIRKADTPPQKVFAAIPLFFAVQQFTEGLLWLSLTYSHYAGWEDLATHTFLVFAWMIWPVYVPLSVLLLEQKPKRRLLLKLFLITGIIVSGTLTYKLFFNDVDADIMGYHIKYTMDYQFPYPGLFGIFYFIPIVVSLYISSVRKMWYMGTMVLIAFIATTLFYEEYLISVWCFFAAITSFMVLWMIYRIKSFNSVTI